MARLARLRRFLDNLPELADSLLMVKFTIFETSNYRPFIRQCLDNTINLSQSTLGCVLHHRRQESRSGRATGRISKDRHHNGSRAKSRQQRTSGEYKMFAQALRWDKYARIHHRLIICFYLYHLIKNILIDSISYDLTSSSSSFLRHFRFLDCLLLGRFRFVGRTNKISAEITNVFMVALLVYRSTIHSRVPKFKFYVLEFLMSSHAEVLKQEFKATPPTHKRTPSIYKQIFTGRSQVGARPTPFGQHQFVREGQAREETKTTTTTTTTTTKTLGVNSIYYLRCPFDQHESKWILRLNRTGKSWLALNLCTKLLIYWSVFAVFVWFVLLYQALAGSILTNKGFEMSYPACVTWLRDLQRTETAANNYSHVYLAPQVLAHEMRLDDLPARVLLDTTDFPQANLYNFARIAFDIIENHLLYLEFILVFSAQFYLLSISSIDIILNALAIKVRLVSVLEKLEAHKRLALEHKTRAWCYPKFIEAHRQFEANQRQQSTISPNLGPNVEKVSLGSRLASYPGSAYNYRHLSLFATQADDELDEQLDDQLGQELADEIANLQAILADHFDTIVRGYNLFVSFAVNFLLFIWLSYTIVICTWIGAVKSRAIEWEFLIAESGGTVFALVLLSCAAVVRSRNVQLYPLIARAMALDSASSPTKTRWTLILAYFHPRPFYCFTLFGSTEVSLLLCLKLISWILSAFILLANFYYTNRF